MLQVTSLARACVSVACGKRHCLAVVVRPASTMARSSLLDTPHMRSSIAHPSLRPCVSCTRPLLGVGSARSIPLVPRPRLPTARPLATRAASVADAGRVCAPQHAALPSHACRSVKHRVTAPQPETTTRPELPKAFEPADAEQRIYDWWESQGYFMPSNDPDAPAYVVPMPPPNVTGRLHMGHAMFSTLEDIMTRYARMQGRATLWLPGTDHAGIATQARGPLDHACHQLLDDSY